MTKMKLAVLACALLLILTGCAARGAGKTEPTGGALFNPSCCAGFATAAPERAQGNSHCAGLSTAAPEAAVTPGIAQGGSCCN